MAETITGTRDVDLCHRLFADVQQSLWMPADLKEEEVGQKLQAALAGLLGIEPRTELEGMLAVQIVATHNAAMECFDVQPSPGRRSRVVKLA